MPAQQALSSPYGSKAIAEPIPTDMSGPEAAAGAKVPKMGAMPAGAPEQVQGGAQPPQNLFDQELEKTKKGQAGARNPFEEMDPNLPMGYTPLTPKLRKTPSGTMEHLKEDGKWVPFGDAENEVAGHFMNGLEQFAIRSKEDIPRFIGAIAGTALAQRMGFGPLAEAIMAGGSQAAAGMAADISQSKPITAGGVAADVGIGAAASFIPSKIGSILEKKAAQAGTEATIAPLVKQGGQALMDRQQIELAAAQAIGAKPGPTQTAQEFAAIQRMGPEAQKLYQMQWGKAAQFKESLAQAVSRLGGADQEIGIEEPNFYKVIGNVLKTTGETTTKLKGLAKEVSGDAIHDIDPVISKMREEIVKMMPKGANIFDDSGKINNLLLTEAKEKYPTLFSSGSRELVNVYNELYDVSKAGAGTTEIGAFAKSTAADKLLEPVARQNESNVIAAMDSPKPRLAPGLTLDEMDAYRAAFGKRANFQGLSRDETNDAYARLHHTMSNHLDSKMIDVLKDKHPGKASELMGAKDFYSGIKEVAEDLQAKVAHDPENAARALIDVKNPVQVKHLWSMLTKKEQNNLSGSYLNTLLDPAVDDVTGRMKITAADNAWHKVDPKIKELMYGKDGTNQINQLINYAKGINLKATATYDPHSDPLMGRVKALAQNRTLSGAMNFVASLFGKNPKAQDYVVSELSGVLMPTGSDQVALMKRQQFMNRMSKAMVSRWTKYGIAPAISSEIETHDPGDDLLSAMGGP